MVLRCTRAEAVQVAVVRNVQEELRTTRVRPMFVGQGQALGSGGNPGNVFILDVHTIEASLRRANLLFLEGPIWRAAGTRPGVVRTLGMEATNWSMKPGIMRRVSAFVANRCCQVDKFDHCQYSSCVSPFQAKTMAMPACAASTTV